MEEEKQIEDDKELRQAIQECAKVVEEKCGKRPYLIVISKANVGFKSDEDKQKRLLSGTTTYMYMAKPTLRKDGISKSLMDAAKHAVKLAEEGAQEGK
jgi:hypothetical protein